MFDLVRRIKLALKPDLLPSDLASLLEGLSPKLSFPERLVTLGQLMVWIRQPVAGQIPEDVPEFVHARNIRLKFLFSFLERNEIQAINLAKTIQEIITPGGAVALYCLTGLSENHAFTSELANRISQKFLPDTFQETGLSEVFKIIFTEEEDAYWIESSFPQIFQYLTDFLKRHGISTDALKSDILDAKVILAAQAASFGTSKEIRRRIGMTRISHSSFLKLNNALNSQSDEAEIPGAISACRLDLQKVKAHIEESGVSIDIIFKLEKLSQILDRIEMLIDLENLNEQSHQFILKDFVAKLIRDELKSLGIKSYITENLHLLTRKIVEHSGERGDHYIAKSKEEERKLFVAATWAGILTAFTALFKYLIGFQRFPLFFEGFFFFANYALSFLIMQRWHLALSSKQPAYTASALSKFFEEFKKKTRTLDEVGIEIKRIFKSQFLTTIGNLAWVIPGCIVIDMIILSITGDHLMSQRESLAVIKKHDPFMSLSLVYAFITGIFLWLSSLIAGLVENWITYNELHVALTQNSFMKKLFSKNQLLEMKQNFAVTTGGVAGNLAIAFFLTVPYGISQFTSIPMDIRHITLAAGTVTFALNSLEWNLQNWDLILKMIISISAIGILNFGVSFYFSIRMAALARNLDESQLNKIFRIALRTKKNQSRVPDLKKR